MTDVDLVPVTRPDGKVYLPRKGLRAVWVDDPDNGPREPSAYIYVLGGHDVERAFNLAARLAASEGCGVDRESAQQTWLRLTMRNGDRVYDFDSVRGAAAVVFDVTDEPVRPPAAGGSGTPEVDRA